MGKLPAFLLDDAEEVIKAVHATLHMDVLHTSEPRVIPSEVDYPSTLFARVETDSAAANLLPQAE